MCMFCSTIPAVLALGVSGKVHQDRKRKEQIEKGLPIKKATIPAGAATGIAIAGLVAAAVIVHTQQGAA